MTRGRGSQSRSAPDPDVEPLICACATVRRASRAVTQFYDSRLRAHGIEGPQFALLAMLNRLGDCRQTDLGRRLDLDKTTLSRNVKLLQRNGWIEVTAGADARERRIALTAAGRRRLSAARPAWQAAQEQLRSCMRKHDWAMTISVLDAMTHAARVAR
jgi:DNA-binding MarR family transcriptional regulator